MIETGGPAFPVTPTDNSGQIGPTEYGMNLRDWFAGMAMQGWLASYGEDSRHPAQSGRGLSILAADAYATADAMIAKKGKR